MTRSLNIVNTSNWDGEDYAVHHDGTTTILKPTDTVTLHAYERCSVHPLAVVPCGPETPKPFVDEDGYQLLPQLTVRFEHCNRPTMIAVSAERDGPDYTGRVLLTLPAPVDGTAVSLDLDLHDAGRLFGKLGPVLALIEANADPS